VTTPQFSLDDLNDRAICEALRLLRRIRSVQRGSPDQAILAGNSYTDYPLSLHSTNGVTYMDALSDLHAAGLVELETVENHDGRLEYVILPPPRQGRRA